MKRRKARRDYTLAILLAMLVFLVAGMTAGRAFGNDHQIRIVLDAAYGGSNAGIRGLVEEAAVNEAVVSALEQKLMQDDRFAVYRSHDAGTDADVKQRRKTIAKIRPDLVISIHGAYSPDETISGMHICPQPSAEDKNQKSLKAAEALRDAFTEDTWKADIGYMYFQQQTDGTYHILRSETDEAGNSSETWGILEGSGYPAVVVEQFYISNPQDLNRWTNEEGYGEIADRYYEALNKLYGNE